MGGQTTTSYRRDPVSELLDDGSRGLLERVYAAKGEWVSTRLADPGPLTRAFAAAIGIDLDEPDNAPTRSGKRQNAHTRYGRAFVRSLHYIHKWYGPGSRPGRLRVSRRMTGYERPLEIEWGSRVRALGVIPAGRAIRVRVRPGRTAARRAVQSLPEGDRIYADDGAPAGRHAEAEGRDWA